MFYRVTGVLLFSVYLGDFWNQLGSKFLLSLLCDLATAKPFNLVGGYYLTTDYPLLEATNNTVEGRTV
jgi:hypothetical protein